MNDAFTTLRLDNSDTGYTTCIPHLWRPGGEGNNTPRLTRTTTTDYRLATFVNSGNADGYGLGQRPDSGWVALISFF